MNRIWLALALLFSLWLTPAAASARVPVPGQGAVARGAPEYHAHEVARAPTGLELFQLRAPAVDRSPGTASDLAVAGAGADPILARPPLWPVLEAEFDVRLRHGEHLPYYPIAPPVLR